jgi:hypothetical protein
MGQTIEKEKMTLIPPQIKPKRRVPLYRSDVRIGSKLPIKCPQESTYFTPIPTEYHVVSPNRLLSHSARLLLN